MKKNTFGIYFPENDLTKLVVLYVILINNLLSCFHVFNLNDDCAHLILDLIGIGQALNLWPFGIRALILNLFLLSVFYRRLRFEL